MLSAFNLFLAATYFIFCPSSAAHLSLFEDRKRCLFYHFVPSTFIFTSLKMWPAVVADGWFSLFVSKLNSYKS